MGQSQFCVHAHFYQPPREDPLTGEIPLEPGAAPYRNWNERIHDQCYRPNALLGNFERISFNVGPTLLDWMANFDPRTYEKIIEQDRFNYQTQGVGNAMAQAYNHTILPLASREDKITQVRWGIADFVHRFGHMPTGMWLPETAVDEETLEILAENHIDYTILAPWQAADPNLNTHEPYLVDLPGGKSITVFFYDQDLSTRVSFDPGITTNADAFLGNYVLPKFNPTVANNSHGQLVMVASDGELYGHHQPFRDKFLSYLVGGAVRNRPLQITYPALWLREHPAEKKMKVRSFTSWSCHHGVTRWMGACGCTTHGEWKEPFRQAINEIAAMIDEVYLDTMKPIVDNPWELRHEYIHVRLGDLSMEDLLRTQLGRASLPGEVRLARLLLAAQFEKQRMFTSCGWFFDDFDRIEPRNNVAYAAQAVWLTYLATEIDLTNRAQAWLRPVKSWRTGAHADAHFIHHLNRARNSQELRLV